MCKKEKITLPIKLQCGDTFCYLCLKGHLNDGNWECPDCQNKITENLQQLAKQQATLEIKKKSRYWLYSAAYGPSWWMYDMTTNRQIEIAYSDYQHRYRFFNQKQKSKYGHEVILETSNNESRSPDISSDSEMDLFESPYRIKIGSSEFKLDFSQMKQINCLNVNKYRRIKRVTIDQTLIEDFNSYMHKTYRVKGMAGIRFDIKN